MLYLSGADGTRETQAVLAGTRGVQRPTLLVVDDLDSAEHGRLNALRELEAGLPGLPVLVLAASQDRELAARLEPDATVELEPLDADGVLAIARLYTGEREDAAIPVKQLVAESGGVPRRAHHAAARCGARPGGAAPGRGGRARRARAGRPAACGGRPCGQRRGLQAVQERTEPDAAGRGDLVCPFKGLAMFDVDDSEIFFGRERLVAEWRASPAHH